MKTTYNTWALAILLAILISSLLLACGGGSSGSSSNGGGGGGGGGGLLTQDSGPEYDRSTAYFVNTTSIDIVISAILSGATFHYTSNGSTPSCNSGTAYATPQTVNISATTTLKAISCKSGYDDSAVTTGTYTEVVPDVHASAAGLTPIADAIAAASAGDIVNVPVGTFTENLAGLDINKRITLIGQGSGSDPASNTIIANAPTGDWPIRITTGGIDESNRLAIRNVRVINSTGGTGNNGTGIMIRSAVGYFEFDNVTVMDNEGYGIAFDGAVGNIPDLVVINSHFYNNGSSGFRTPSGDWYIDPLRFDNCIFYGNSNPGIMSYMAGTNANVFITNSTFENNAAAASQYGDIVLSPFNGEVTFNNISIISNTSDAGIRISGSSSGSSPNKTGSIEANNITLTDVTISGTHQSNAPFFYPPGALVVTRYLGLANLVMNNVIMNSTAPHGLFLGTITSGAGPDLGNLELGVGYTNAIALGKHGNSSSYIATNIGIDATGVTFVNAVSGAEIDALIWDAADDGSLGSVSYTTP